MSQWEGPPPGPHEAPHPTGGAPDYAAPPIGPTSQGWHQGEPHDQSGHDQQTHDQHNQDQHSHDQEIDPQYRIDADQLVDAEQSWVGTDDFSSYGVGPGSAGAPVGAHGGSGEARVQVVTDGVPRHGQLSYTSFDTPGQPGGGGWQVKQALGGLDEAETALLRDQVSTQFDAGVQLPAFPTPQQVAELPRRMVYGPLGTVASAIWHTAPAGTDASGRPGNVFAQMLLDRSRSQVAGGRPIELWRSPDWRTPFGADAVRETTLGAEVPRPGGVITTAAVTEFLLDPQAFRLPVLSVLLDACRQAMNGGPPVVLLCASVDRAAMWIGAVSCLMSPEQSRQFFFSTLERATGLPAAFARGVHLACVPHLDADAAGHDLGHVLINEEETPQLGDAGADPHVTVRGDRVPVGPWSGLAQVVLAHRPGEVVAAAEQIAERVFADRAASGVEDALWASALAVVQLGEAYAEAHDEAAAILAAGAPGELADHADLLQLTEATVLHVGAHGDKASSSTAEVWAAAEQATGSGVVPTLLARVYLESAVQDLEWLTGPHRVPMPPAETCQAADLTTARAGATTMARDLADMAVADPVTVGLAAIRLADLADRSGITDEALAEALTAVLGGTVVPALFSADSSTVVRRIGPLGPRTLDRVRHLVSGAEPLTAAPVGQRLHREVLMWLFPTGCGSTLPSGTTLSGPDRLRGEVAAHLADQLPPMRPLATWTALAEGGDRSTVARWFAQPWPIEALQPLLSAFGDTLTSDLWLGTVKAAPASPELTAFCQQIVGTTWSPGRYAGQAVVPVAQLRLLDEQWWRSEHPEADLTTGVIGGSAGQIAPMTPFDPLAERDVRVAVIMAVLDPSALTVAGADQHLNGLVSLVDGTTLELPEEVWDAIASYASRVPTTDLVAGLASTDEALDLRSTLEQARWGWLSGVTHDGVGLVRSLVKHRLTGQDAPGVGELVDQLQALPTRQPVTDQRGRERQLTAWVKELMPSRERGLGRLFGGAG